MFKRPKAPPKPQTAPVEQRQPVPTRMGRGTTAVFSYNNATSAAGSGRRPGRERPDLSRSAKVLRTRRPNWLSRGPLLAIGCLVVILLLADCVVGQHPRIAVVGSESGQIFLRPPATYQQAVQTALGRSILNRTRFTLDTGGIARTLQTQYPELATVRVSLPLIGNQPVVIVEPAVPTLILQTIAGNAYVIDDRGRALLPASQVPQISKLSLPTVTDQSGLSIALGKVALPSSSVTYITEVVGQLRAQQLAIAALTLPAASSELDVRVSGAPYTIRFNLQGNARAEAGTYLAAIAQLNREHKVPSTYIDVRVDERAYYK